MKRQWTTDELVAHWMLEPPELELVNQARTDKNRLGLALLLKWFQYESRFPKRKQEIPAVLLDYVANQLSTDPKNLKEYTWEGRTIARHRGLVRDYLGFREASVKDAEGLTAWLVETVLPSQRKMATLDEAIYDRCREEKLEPPTPDRIERIIRSALRTADARFYAETAKKLPAITRKRLDALLETTKPESNEEPDAEFERERVGRSVLHELKQGTGAVKVDSLLAEISKLQKIEALALPDTLFAEVPPKVLESYRQRLTVEDLHEVQRHPDAIRYTLLAAFCWQRGLPRKAGQRGRFCKKWEHR